MSRIARFCADRLQRLRLSLFEKVILVNASVLICEALAGLWVTSHNLEAHHYLIDTSFIVVATLLSFSINVVLLRASFRPLFHLLHTMRTVAAGGTGDTRARALVTPSDTEIGELAQAFNSMLDRLEQTRREQAMLILQAQEEERRRLALELHDESSQNLTALLVHAEILSQSLQAVSDSTAVKDVRTQLNSGLGTLNELAQHTLDGIRTLAQQLRPGVLDDLGLLPAFRWLADDGQQRLKLAIELHLKEIADRTQAHPYPALYETTLFRIAQECLTNVARHAYAQQVCISLSQDQQHIHLQVRDDGRGYDPAQHSTGLGIPGMRERAALLGGKLIIHSQPGQGTTVEAMLPLPNVHTKGGSP